MKVSSTIPILLFFALQFHAVSAEERILSHLDYMREQRFALIEHSDENFTIEVPAGYLELGESKTELFDRITFTSDSSVALLVILNKFKEFERVFDATDMSPFTVDLGTFEGQKRIYGSTIWTCRFHTPRHGEYYLILSNDHHTPSVISIRNYSIPIVEDLIKKSHKPKENSP
jgi:hypothetical protein